MMDDMISVTKVKNPSLEYGWHLDRWYGYRVRDSSKFWPCVIAANLLTPKVQWKEQGKSTLVIEPFAGTLLIPLPKS